MITRNGALAVLVAVSAGAVAYRWPAPSERVETVKLQQLIMRGSR